MEDRLNYIGSDKYKIEIFKRTLYQEILEVTYLQEQKIYPLSESNDNIVINKVLSNFKNLYEELSENIVINEVLTKLILIEKCLINEVYRDGINVNLENLLFFIMNAKLGLLVDNKGIIEKVVELTQLAITSRDKELQKAGNVIINELVNDDEKYESISNKLNNALIIIEDYNKALEIINNYNITLNNYQEHGIDRNLISDTSLKEVVSLCEKINIIMNVKE
ncbi:MAG TPA: hypothetical protein GXZ90_00425 [Clostridiales bacterium]|nr:hypothetical protein [Clostridiales bacterium]